MRRTSSWQSFLPAVLLASSALVACAEAAEEPVRPGGAEGELRVRTELQGVELGARGDALVVTGTATNLDTVPLEVTVWYAVTAGSEVLERADVLSRAPLAPDEGLAFPEVRLTPAALLRPAASATAELSSVAWHVEFWSEARADAATVDELFVFDCRIEQGIVERITSAEASELTSGSADEAPR